LSEAALLIRQREEAVLQVLILSAFVSVSRTLGEFRVLDCFRSILLEFEHAEHFRFQVSAYLNARMRGTISPVDPKGSPTGLHRPGASPLPRKYSWISTVLRSIIASFIAIARLTPDGISRAA